MSVNRKLPDLSELVRLRQKCTHREIGAMFGTSASAVCRAIKRGELARVKTDKKKHKPGAGLKSKSYLENELKKRLVNEIDNLNNRELFDRVLSLSQEIAKSPNLETARLELEIATRLIRERLKDWFNGNH